MHQQRGPDCNKNTGMQAVVCLREHGAKQRQKQLRQNFVSNQRVGRGGMAAKITHHKRREQTGNLRKHHGGNNFVGTRAYFKYGGDEDIERGQQTADDKYQRYGNNTRQIKINTKCRSSHRTDVILPFGANVQQPGPERKRNRQTSKDKRHRIQDGY